MKRQLSAAPSSPRQHFLRDVARRSIRLVANEPDNRDRAEYGDKLRQVTRDNDLTDPNDVIFVEVTLTDALAALVVAVRDETDRLPHIYFAWTEGNPAAS